MKQTWWKISVLVILLVAIVAVIAQKQQKQVATPREPLASSTSSPTTQATAGAPVKSGDVCPAPAPKTQANVPAQGNGQSASAKGNPPLNPSKTAIVPAVQPVPKALPKLIDVGSTQCIPCKMMAPILDELATEYKGKLVVEFVNVNENRDAAARLSVETIPTQIFYDQTGKEFSRHIGFFPKEDILTTFAKQGITLTR